MIPFSEVRKLHFLDVLRETCNVTLAAQAVGVSTSTVYHARKTDPLFAERYTEALQEGIDLLEAKAHKRAFNGVAKPVFHKGKECGEIVEYSDALTMFLLKAHRPEKYRERSEVKHEGSAFSSLTDTARAARIEALLAKAQARANGTPDEPAPPTVTLDDLA